MKKSSRIMETFEIAFDVFNNHLSFLGEDRVDAETAKEHHVAAGKTQGFIVSMADLYHEAMELERNPPRKKWNAFYNE